MIDYKNPMFVGRSFHLLEMPPQKRTVFFHVCGKLKTHYLYFPYAYFKIYHRKPNGYTPKYLYSLGISYLNGLITFFSPKPVKSPDDWLYLLPIFNTNDGKCCIGENYERSGYDSPEELDKDIIRLYWQNSFNVGFGNKCYESIKNWATFTKNGLLAQIESLMEKRIQLKDLLDEDSWTK